MTVVLYLNLPSICIQEIVNSQTRNKNYQTVGTVSKSNSKIIETEKKMILLTHKYMTTRFPGLVQYF